MGTNLERILLSNSVSGTDRHRTISFICGIIRKLDLKKQQWNTEHPKATTAKEGCPLVEIGGGKQLVQRTTKCFKGI